MSSQNFVYLCLAYEKFWLSVECVLRRWVHNCSQLHSNRQRYPPDVTNSTRWVVDTLKFLLTIHTYCDRHHDQKWFSASVYLHYFTYCLEIEMHIFCAVLFWTSNVVWHCTSTWQCLTNAAHHTTVPHQKQHPNSSLAFHVSTFKPKRTY